MGFWFKPREMLGKTVTCFFLQNTEYMYVINKVRFDDERPNRYVRGAFCSRMCAVKCIFGPYIFLEKESSVRY